MEEKSISSWFVTYLATCAVTDWGLTVKDQLFQIICQDRSQEGRNEFIQRGKRNDSVAKKTSEYMHMGHF